MTARGRNTLIIAAVIIALAAGLMIRTLSGRDQQPPGPPLGDTALKYRLVDEFDPVFYCDPDYYPVGSEEQERQNADTWWGSADPSSEEVTAILERLALEEPTSDEGVLRLYREHKLLGAVGLEPAEAGFRFTLRSGEEIDGFAIEGRIARDGVIRVDRRERTETACPICLEAGTMIDTPEGPIAVSALRPGMRVWTTDAAGRRTEGSVLRTTRRQTGAPVLLLRIALADGRRLVAASAHPTADGRLLGALTVGDALDGSKVSAVEIVPVATGVTHDLLPSGATGAYWANGVLLGSTLRQ